MGAADVPCHCCAGSDPACSTFNQIIPILKGETAEELKFQKQCGILEWSRTFGPGTAKREQGMDLVTHPGVPASLDGK